MREARVKVLIMKERKRTLKALQAIVRGIWMVDESWLNKVRLSAFVCVFMLCAGS